MSAALGIQSVMALLVGVGLGLFHFGALHRITQTFVEGSLRATLALQLVRLALLGVVLAGAAWLGALPLLTCFGGILLGRAVILRRAREDT